jgi:hypothetical protein
MTTPRHSPRNERLPKPATLPPMPWLLPQTPARATMGDKEQDR